MSYKGSLSRLLFLLLMWMIITTCACALILLGDQSSDRTSPRRTRAPEGQR